MVNGNGFIEHQKVDPGCRENFGRDPSLIPLPSLDPLFKIFIDLEPELHFGEIFFSEWVEGKKAMGTNGPIIQI